MCSFGRRTEFIVLLTVLLAAMTPSVRTIQNVEVAEAAIERCDRVARQAVAAERATMTLDTPTSIHGKWVSESCETRPGPEFLLRSYTFHANNSFRLLQFYYSDESCSSAAYTVSVQGRLKPTRRTWGAQESDYDLHRVSVVAQTAEVAQQLAARVNSTCQNRVSRRWKSYKEYPLLNMPEEVTNLHPYGKSTSTEKPTPAFNTYRGNKRNLKNPNAKFNCLHALNLVFHELHLFKVQIRPGINSKSEATHYRHELLLGDIHSRLEARAGYRPTAFQVPLLKVDTSLSQMLGLKSESLIQSDSLLNIDLKPIGDRERESTFLKGYIGHFDLRSDGVMGPLAPYDDAKSEEAAIADKEIFRHCHICSVVDEANEISPPRLIAKPMLPVFTGGEWASLRCEIRPLGLYLTRHFRFYDGDKTWIVEYKFYADSLCSEASFSVTAAGHYKIGKNNHHVPGGTEVDFHLERASITVFESHMLHNLESDPQCGVGPWEIAVPRELSSTNGCTTIGLAVPSVEYELMKLEVDFEGSSLLYMGQADTENRRRSSKERPTAYQPALIQCKDLPPYSDSLRDILNTPIFREDVYGRYDYGSLALTFSEYSSSGVSFKLHLLTFIISLVFNLCF